MPSQAGVANNTKNKRFPADLPRDPEVAKKALNKLGTDREKDEAIQDRIEPVFKIPHPLGIEISPIAESRAKNQLYVTSHNNTFTTLNIIYSR